MLCCLKALQYAGNLNLGCPSCNRWLLQGLISHAEVLEIEALVPSDRGGDKSQSPPGSRGASLSLTSRLSRQSTHGSPNSEDQITLYEHGKHTDTFTLILQGKVLIRTGESWSQALWRQTSFYNVSASLVWKVYSTQSSSWWLWLKRYREAHYTFLDMVILEWQLYTAQDHWGQY